MHIEAPRTRHGFALIAVLWIIVGVSVLALAMNLAGRDALSSAQNRLNRTRAWWRAEGCLERARVAAAEALAGQAAWMQRQPSWESLDRAILTSPYVVDAHCDVTVRSPGVALDVNAAPIGPLDALFMAAGLPAAESDSLGRAIVEWRGDDTSRIERASVHARYVAAGMIPPRFGQFADVRELRRVRGFEQARSVTPDLDSLLTTEPGRVNPARAPVTVLSALPGMTPPLIARIVALRNLGAPVTDLAAIAATLPPDVQDSLTDHYLALRSMLAGQTDAWIVSALATEGVAPASTAIDEVRLARNGTRLAIVRRRVWP
jgi:general secretion pathway protein K